MSRINGYRAYLFQLRLQSRRIASEKLNRAPLSGHKSVGDLWTLVVGAAKGTDCVRFHAPLPDSNNSIKSICYQGYIIYPEPTSLTSPIKHSRVLSPHSRIPKMASAVSKRLEGKTVLITGASSGIGKSTAFEFARTSPKNLKLVLTARRIDNLRQIAEDIVKEVGDGVKVHPVQLDVSKPEEVRSFVSKLPAEFSEIDVLVNNA